MPANWMGLAKPSAETDWTPKAQSSMTVFLSVTVVSGPGTIWLVVFFVVPLYYQLRDLGQTNTYQALIFPQVAQSLAFGTFWMRAYFRGTSRELVESARLDGAGHFRG